jgi:threonine/homoserine/homoserine lactone efflux protein
MVVIKSLGAAYLLWLALKAFRSAASPKGISAAPAGALGSDPAYFRRGLIIQMTNPKAAMVWVATMSLALSEGSSVLVLGPVVVGCSLISFAGHLAYALMFSTPRIMARYAKSRRWLECALGTYFCFASYKLATMKV